MKEVIWMTTPIVTSGSFARFFIDYTGQLSGKRYTEYQVRVSKDGTWNCYKEKGGWWTEVNGVCEEAEPVLKRSIRKAQALLILKG
jgi:hypothetical protein